MNKHNCFEIKNLRSGYSGHEILKGVTAEINFNNLISLIGPNGSGKSTLLRALSGLQPYTGSLKLNLSSSTPDRLNLSSSMLRRISTQCVSMSKDGLDNNREVNKISRRDFGALVGVVPQNFRPAYPFSVWEVIAMGRLPHKKLFDRIKPEDEDLVINAAQRVGIEHLLTRNVMSLSGGEAQRVLIACVLAQDPPVLLLDEPTSALDPNQAARVFKLLKELVKNEFKTVITVVHDINTSLEFSDGYLALKDGVLISHGDIKELDGSVLKNLYNSDFESYYNERGEVMWRACAN